MSSSDMLARELTDSDREECLREILEWELGGGYMIGSSY